MNVLLLGGIGFIGFHTAEKLLQSTAYHVDCYDLFDDKAQQLPGWQPRYGLEQTLACSMAYWFGERKEPS